jgi:hypothetical protein
VILFGVCVHPIVPNPFSTIFPFWCQRKYKYKWEENE